MSKEMPPGATAQLDQLFAEANEKYTELIEILRKLTEEHGIYGAMAIMGSSIEAASNATLVSMVLTGMRREVLRGSSVPESPTRGNPATGGNPLIRVNAP